MHWLRRLSEEVAAQRPCALVTIVAAPDARSELVGRKLLVRPGQAIAGGLGDAGLETAALDLAAAQMHKDRPGTAEKQVTEGTVRLYIEPYMPPPMLVVVGAGHVGQPVAVLGKQIGFAVAVIDDRPAFANRERFPTADQILCTEFIPALRSLNLGPRHWVILVTRGHKHDLECLREIIHLPLAYIGMIGSKLRIAGVFDRLRREGVTAALIDRVYSPIGLDIGAENPTELAVSIIGELIMVRRGGDGGSLSHAKRAAVHGYRRVRLKE